MNEQLIVKNFGPIKDATVDFKRVTVFIGPTGGGKSTLAKLAAILKKGETDENGVFDANFSFKDVSIDRYIQSATEVEWTNSKGTGIKIGDPEGVNIDNLLASDETHDTMPVAQLNNVIAGKNRANFEHLKTDVIKNLKDRGVLDIDENRLQEIIRLATEEIEKKLVDTFYKKNIFPTETHYLPSERSFIAAIGYSWPGFLRDDIGLPKPILDFANSFSTSRKTILELPISFLDITYIHSDGQDFIRVPGVETLFRLYETASGIQSVTPLLVLLEHLSRNIEQAQSFIIEEPELNLYPTAQQGLLDWLVEKCTKGANDLTITTHSPYILSHLNLLLYAYQVAEKHPDRAEEVAELVPRVSWINPKEFACYQVENGGVTSLVSEDLGLIDDNGLDNLSGDAADAFDNLIRLSKGVARK
ncbi:MAG: hypothetical protein EOO56_13460 [Hymenobacter sp.]|nr:MAG: hypothetical protein EOO56_13460 [Hymenobacter sp.]